MGYTLVGDLASPPFQSLTYRFAVEHSNGRTLPPPTKGYKKSHKKVPIHGARSSMQPPPPKGPLKPPFESLTTARNQCPPPSSPPVGHDQARHTPKAFPRTVEAQAGNQRAEHQMGKFHHHCYQPLDVAASTTNQRRRRQVGKNRPVDKTRQTPRETRLANKTGGLLTLPAGRAGGDKPERLDPYLAQPARDAHAALGGRRVGRAAVGALARRRAPVDGLERLAVHLERVPLVVVQGVFVARHLLGLLQYLLRLPFLVFQACMRFSDD